MNRPRRCPQHLDHHAGCQPCRAHAAWYYRTRRSLQQAGEWAGMVDATETRSHLAALLDAGMCRLHIAQRSGITQETVAAIADGHRHRILADTAAAILGVTVRLTPYSQPPAAGSIRRVRALVWQGRTRAWIAAESGVALGTVRLLADGKLERVTQQTRDRLADVFRRHVDRPAPDSKAARAVRRRAVAEGWHGPGAWDDIDDPDARPDREPIDEDPDYIDVVAVRNVLDGQLPFNELKPAEQLALFRDHAYGLGMNHLMSKLRMSASTIGRWREKASGERMAA